MALCIDSGRVLPKPINKSCRSILRSWEENRGQTAFLILEIVVCPLLFRTASNKKPPQAGAVRYSFDKPRFTKSITARIVRVPVVTIRHAIAVTVAIDAVRNAIMVAIATPPTAAVQMPAIIAMLPFRVLIVVADAYPFPMAADPHMPSAIPIPIAGRPYIAPAWGRNDFISCRRRGVANNDVDTSLRGRLRRDKGSSTENNC